MFTTTKGRTGFVEPANELTYLQYLHGDVDNDEVVEHFPDHCESEDDSDDELDDSSGSPQVESVFKRQDRQPEEQTIMQKFKTSSIRQNQRTSR